MTVYKDQWELGVSEAMKVRPGSLSFSFLLTVTELASEWYAASDNEDKAMCGVRDEWRAASSEVERR